MSDSNTPSVSAPLGLAAVADAPVLAHVTRGDFVECVHRATLVALDADGAELFAHGAVREPIYPRSTNKPLQALAMVRAGLDLPPDQLALVCSSHSGEPAHLDRVRSILAGAGLSEADLRNTPDLPLDPAERTRWTREDLPASPLGQNCSGKHAGMLATCVINGWSTHDYLDVDHPLQRAIEATLAEVTGDSVAATAVDGCGAPVMAVSVTGLARAFGALAAADPETPEGRIADAIRSHPELLGGTGRDVTALISGVPGLIAKDGAEAVYAVGLADGRGLALKVADGGAGISAGGQRARPVIMAAALRRIGVKAQVLEDQSEAPVLGHGQPVGRVVAVGV
ncbi:asparaginase [Janibacter sp. G1551]|uniref:asparaginase n=1 Tax=Janibacter sp. G1551 TaxID=3420440 RepID=UPI003D03CD19